MLQGQVTGMKLKYEISNSIWEKVNSEVDMCKGVKCPHYSKCHFFKD